MHFPLGSNGISPRYSPQCTRVGSVYVRNNEPPDIDKKNRGRSRPSSKNRSENSVSLFVGRICRN
jgi:hypothetical protein